MKPKEKKYDELVAKFTKHCSPTLSEVMQHFRFNSRLSCIVLHSTACNYGDTLNEMLRDRIVWGINNEPIQKKLLQGTDLTCCVGNSRF